MGGELEQPERKASPHTNAQRCFNAVPQHRISPAILKNDETAHSSTAARVPGVPGGIRTRNYDARSGGAGSGAGGSARRGRIALRRLQCGQRRLFFHRRPGDAFIHIAAYARWVNLGFNWGVDVPDPAGILQGSGRRVRHIRIAQPADLRNSPVRALIRAAVARARRPESKEAAAGSSVVRAIYAKRRRPAQ